MIFDTSNPIKKRFAEELFTKMCFDNKIVEIKEVKPRRSYSQNRYLHLLLGVFSDSTGYNTDEAKMIYKRVSKKIFFYQKNSQMFVRSSADITTEEMVQSIDAFKGYCEENLGIKLPEAHETEYLQALEMELKQRGY